MNDGWMHVDYSRLAVDSAYVSMFEWYRLIDIVRTL